MIMSMNSQTISQTDDLNWALFALIIFLVTFTAVAIRVWVTGDAAHKEASMLPLEDDDVNHPFPREPNAEVL